MKKILIISFLLLTNYICGAKNTVSETYKEIALKLKTKTSISPKEKKRVWYQVITKSKVPSLQQLVSQKIYNDLNLAAEAIYKGFFYDLHAEDTGKCKTLSFVDFCKKIQIQNENTKVEMCIKAFKKIPIYLEKITGQLKKEENKYFKLN